MPVLDDGTRLRPGILSYVEPGCGFGGSCFPKDVRSLIAFSREKESPLKIMEAVIDVNERQPGRMVDMLRRHISELDGVEVAVLGAAFKPGTDDIRESPGIEVARQLADAGAQVTLVDPIATDRAREVLGDRVAYATDLTGIPKSVQGILLITAWDEFSGLPELVAALDPPPVVVDGRRFYSTADFERYEAIGL
jgi:UDPglucose 6-dehydrogenase/GDP-mannose 6-dehydrogenase